MGEDSKIAAPGASETLLRGPPKGPAIAFVSVIAVALIAVVLFVVVLKPPALTAEERYRVASIEMAISATTLDGSSYDETLRGVDQLIDLCRAKGHANYDDRTVREVVEDAAHSLQAYRPELAARLDRALDSSCR